LNKEIEPPFVPSQKDDNFDYKQQITNEQTNPEVAKQNALLLRRNSVQSLFNGYAYDASLVQQNQNTSSSNHQITISTTSYTHTNKTSQHY